MNNHSIKGTTLETSVRTFVCCPRFMITDYETKENQSIKYIYIYIYIYIYQSYLYLNADKYY